MKILVSGCAGFIGSNLVDRLLSLGHEVVGIDNFNDYYNPHVKEQNLEGAIKSPHFKLHREDILNFDEISEVFKEESPAVIIHLAARAGVRPSIDNPLLYTKVNVEGTVNLLKLSADCKVKQFIFGSSSSVYGNSSSLPFSEDDLCQKIISPYGASKRSAEFFVESFHRNFGLKSTILRFFTVYGPRGRPDMAPAIFAKAILAGGEINKFGDGTTSRDYTFIGDIIDGIMKVLETNLDFEIINLGGNSPVTLNDFIKTVEKISGKKAKIKAMDRQAGDADRTWANIEKARKIFDWEPKTKLEEGLEIYLDWLGKNGQ